MYAHPAAPTLAHNHHHHPPSAAPRPNDGVGINQWSTSLFSWHDACEYLNAFLCPCVFVHQVADYLENDRSRDASSCGLLYSYALSCLLDVPFFFCLDQFSTRAVDYVADREVVRASIAQRQEDAEEAAEDGNSKRGLMTNPLSWITRHTFDYLLVNGRFGEDHPPPSWEHDGVGWDLNGNSEDWWPCCWCGWHLHEACLAVCCHCACCGGEAPRLPLCFSCLLAAVYPLCVCPITCVLRRIVISRGQIAERCIDSALLSLLCPACTIVQTVHQVKQWEHRGVAVRPPATVNRI